MIRHATPADPAAICRVHQDSVRGLCGARYTTDEIEAWIGHRVPEDYAKDIVELEVLVATDTTDAIDAGDGVVGFAVLDVVESEVMAVYVHPTVARGGMGRALLRALEAIAAERGITALRVDASLNAAGFYAVSGYATIERRIHRLLSGTELRCLLMTKTL